MTAKLRETPLPLKKMKTNGRKAYPTSISVVVKIITDTNVVATNLKSGQDISTALPSKEIKNFESDPNFTVVNKPPKL